jgi:antibiotic biosynthesis monooxygenase (ABM) superfamily enzyme
MIARHWRGWTKASDAPAYEALLQEKIFPRLRGITGYRGGYLLRRDRGEEIEFVVINFFDSMESVRAFAGEDYETAVFEPEAKALLSRFDAKAEHFSVAAKV